MSTTAEQLAEARAARHELLVGRRAVQIRHSDGKQLTYAEADLAKIDAHIAALEAEQATAGDGERRARAIGVVF